VWWLLETLSASDDGDTNMSEFEIEQIYAETYGDE
jgi:hypothetical protein